MSIRFNYDARRIMALANIKANVLGSREMDHLGSREIGPLHLLIALLEPEEGTLHHELKESQHIREKGYDVDQIREKLEEYLAQSRSLVSNANSWPRTEFSQYVKDAADFARQLAQKRGEEFVTPKHILYGLVQVCRKSYGENPPPQLNHLESHLLPPAPPTDKK